MSKVVEIKASTWTREDLPGFHVRYTIPDDAEVKYHGIVATPDEPLTASMMAKVPAAGPIEGEGGGKGSVIAQVLTGGFMQTDASGNLVNRDGSLHTQATPNDPWPFVIDSVSALQQWQIDHPGRPDAIFVDGNRIGQPGLSPGVRYAARDNKLYLEYSPPVGVKIEAPAATATEPARITIPPPAGHQIDVVLNGPSIVTLTNIPAPNVPGRMGFVRITDMAGEQMPVGMVEIIDADGENVLYDAPANGFSCQIAVDDGVIGAQVETDAGESLTVTALDLVGPVLLSYRTPNW
jgi:hypothetical protein